MKTNYHMHTTFCDGKNSAAEMARAAFEKQFDIIGFSGHSMYPFAGNCHIALRDFQSYVDTIRALAREYEGRMKILCGFEAEYIPTVSVPRMSDYAQFKPDYLIGAVHYVGTDKGLFSVDDSVGNVQYGIETIFGGKAKEAVCLYFSLQREMLEKGDFLIWAHPDVIRKRNGVLRFFDEKESWYKAELVATAQCAQKAGVIAEINTGAIARGAMDSLYPSDEFLAILRAHDVPITINSDAHATSGLDCAFDRAISAAKKAGYTQMMFFDEGCVKSQPL